MIEVGGCAALATVETVVTRDVVSVLNIALFRTQTTMIPNPNMYRALQLPETIQNRTVDVLCQRHHTRQAKVAKGRIAGSLWRCENQAGHEQGN